MCDKLRGQISEPSTSLYWKSEPEFAYIFKERRNLFQGVDSASLRSLAGWYDKKSPNFKLSRSPRIDSKESIPPAYVARRAGTATLFLLGSKPP